MPAALAIRRWCAMIEPDRPRAQVLQRGIGVGHTQDRLAGVPELHDPFLAFRKKRHVPHAQDLVDDQDVRVHAHRHRKGQPLTMPLE